MNILLVSGIWTNGRDSVDQLYEPLTAFGHNVIDVVQPIRSPWDVRSKARREADAMDIVRIAERYDDVSVVGHSYGGLKSSYAMRHYPFKAAYLFRPAMSRKWEFPISTKVTCIYSKQDWAVWFGGLLIGHEFGWAGRKGFKNPQPNVKNVRSMGRHSADFTESMRYLWAEYINRDLAKI